MNTITVNTLGTAPEKARKPQGSSTTSPTGCQSSWHQIVQDAIAAAVVSSGIIALAYLYWAS